MSSLNKVMLIGNLGMDPELRRTNGGTAVMTLRVATTETWRDRDGEQQEKTEWHRVTFWGKPAEGLGRFATKGMKVYVEGSLETRSWDDNDGNKRYSTEVKAQVVRVLDRKQDGGRAPRGSDSKYDERQTSMDTDGYGSPNTDSDDIPF